MVSATGVLGAVPFLLAWVLTLFKLRTGCRFVRPEDKATYIAAAGCLTSVLAVAVGEAWLAVVGGLPPFSRG